MNEENKIPNLPLKNGKPPRAFIRVDISTMIPRDRENPDAGGDEGRADPLIFPIYEAGSKQRDDELPPGMLTDLRKLFGGVVKHCRNYVPQAPIVPANDVLVTGGEVLPGGTTSMPSFITDGGVQEKEQGICPKCGWRELECECEKAS